MFGPDFAIEQEKLPELLVKTQKLLVEEFALTPIMSFELEFFLLKNNEQLELTEANLAEFCNSVKEIALNHGLKIGNIAKEVGELQYEVNFKYGSDLIKLAEDLNKIKLIIANIANSYNCFASFAAKPHQNKDVGSGMHVHLSLANLQHENIFQEKNAIFYQVIAGLLNNLPASMLFFITDKADFSRLVSKFSVPASALRYRTNATNAPINVSWGINNRTTALRIPDHHQDLKARRIEHRVPSSNANPYLVLIAILLGTYLGLKNKVPTIDKIWGNAFDEQYSLTALPINLAEAKQCFNHSDIKNLLDKLLSV
ncbi:MAG: hypothetical protein ACO2XZ_01290 [Rickettsiales bacterium]